MFAPIEKMLALRYLRSRKQEGFISVVSGFSLIGIALGVATLIVVMAVMNGFRQELFTRILGMDGHVSVVNLVAGIPEYKAIIDDARKLSGVIEANAMVEGQVMVLASDIATGAAVRGLSSEDIKAKKVLADSLPESALNGFDESENVMIGRRMASNLGLMEGSELTIISPQSRSTVMGTIPRMKTYRVGAIFDVGMYEYDSAVILMPLKAAQVFFKLQGAANVVEIKLAEPMRAAITANEVKKIVASHHAVHSWQRTHSQIVNALQVERNVMFLILTLIILVAAFNIISSLIMLVRDKEADIAILRTMGATRGAILRIFFLCGSSIGVLGTLSGTALGLLFALNIESIRQGLQAMTGTDLFSAEIYFLSTLPADVQAAEVVKIVVMALLLTFLATIYPSWRAAKTEPAQTLRYK